MVKIDEEAKSLFADACIILANVINDGNKEIIVEKINDFIKPLGEVWNLTEYKRNSINQIKWDNFQERANKIKDFLEKQK